MPSMRMAPRRRGWVTALLTVLAVLLFALERLVVDDLRARHMLNGCLKYCPSV